MCDKMIRKRAFVIDRDNHADQREAFGLRLKGQADAQELQ